MIGHCNRWHLQLLRRCDERINLIHAIKNRVLGMQMKVDKVRHQSIVSFGLEAGQGQEEGILGIQQISIAAGSVTPCAAP